LRGLTDKTDIQINWPTKIGTHMVGQQSKNFQLHTRFTMSGDVAKSFRGIYFLTHAVGQTNIVFG